MSHTIKTLKYGRNIMSNGMEPLWIAIDECEKLSWRNIDRTLDKVCADQTNFIKQNSSGIFDDSSNARKEFNRLTNGFFIGASDYHAKNQEKFFKSYVKWVTAGKNDKEVVETPAMIPETVIELPREFWEKGATSPTVIPYMVADFLWRDRKVSESDIVIEIDGNSHYEPVREEKITEHSAMADDERARAFTNHTIRGRTLALEGYKIYRFSMSELDRQDIDCLLHPFFDKVFKAS